MSLCHGSGFTIGGYREEYREDVIQVTCTKCWLRVPAQPISSEWRTDLRTDGLPVEVLRKQIVDHEFRSRWFGNNHRGSFKLGAILFFISLMALVLDFLK
jgi:hypothetical protein